MNRARPTGWIRIGINAEKRILHANTSSFDGLSVPAHVLALYRNSLSDSISRWGKPYYIDPMTYVFFLPHDIVMRSDDSGPKKSYEKLCEYSPRTKVFLNQDSLVAEDMSHSEATLFSDAIAQLALNIQSLGDDNSIASRRSMGSLRRIRDHLQHEATDSGLPNPSFLVSPYFYVDSTSSRTYEIWQSSVSQFERKVSEASINLPVYRAACISPNILSDQPSTAQLIRYLAERDGALLWVSGFEKCTPDIETLEGFGNLIRGISESGSQVHSLYGGYLTACYYHLGLSGLSYGLNSGDSKEVGSFASGGGAPNRYYEPRLHSFQSANSMLTYFGESVENARNFSCECPICNETRVLLHSERDRDQLTSHLMTLFRQYNEGRVDADWGDMRTHFLHVRSAELQHIGQSMLIDLEEEARRTLLQFEGEEQVNLETLRCLVRLAELQ